MHSTAVTDRFDGLHTILSKQYGPFSLAQWCVLALVPLILYTFSLGRSRVLTDHEILLGTPAKQMLQTGDWLLPRIGDQLWLEKPPAPIWIAAISSWIAGGVSELSVRLPSALAGVGVVLLVAGMMARLFGPTTGLLCGIFQASTVYMLTYARLAEADITLLLICMAAVAAFVHIQHLPEDGPQWKRRLWLICFWGLIGLTNLSKGVLFGAVLMLVTCLGSLVVSRDWRGLKRMWSPGGFVLMAVIALIWPAWVVAREPSVLDLWSWHLFGRAAGGSGYDRPVWYYLTTWPVQLLPWTPLLFVGAGPSLRRAWRERRSPDRFVWWWALSQLCLLSASSGKNHHYLIYALPAMSPVIAMGYLRTSEFTASRVAWSVNWGRVLMWGVAPVAVVAGFIAGHYAGEFRPDVWVLSLIVGAGCLAVGYFTVRGAPTPSLASIMTAFLLASCYVHGWVMPRRDPSADDNQFIAAVERNLPKDAVLIATGGAEIARHIFYLDRSIEGVWNADDIEQRIRGEKVFYALTREWNRGSLDRYGRTTKLSQSVYTSREKNETDRNTLFRVDVVPQVARDSQPQRQ